ncbi:MAG: hypothetical protein JWO32_320 [Bacteroidetes bacterium]|nr:hypothetical protein [Bacteroidota bacterium]
MIYRIVTLISLLPFLSCVKDKPHSANTPQTQLSTDKKVYVINEGNFMAANATISLYDPGTSQVIEKFYHDQNNGSQLGDVAQSMINFNSRFYIVINNSGKIVACDDQFKLRSTINGFTSPRYVLPVSNSKAYVSDLYSNKVFVVNLNSNSISSSIPCPGWTEKMVLSYNKVFVTNVKRNYTYVIDASSDLISDSIVVGPAAESIVLDKNDHVWVLSAGNNTASIVPSLKQIDPLTNQILLNINFNLSDSPGSLCLNRSKDTLFFLNGGIYKMDINSLAIPPDPIIPKGNRSYYGLGINPNDYTIYASDALDYIQRSVVYIFDASGNEKSFFKAGINSNSFYFE